MMNRVQFDNMQVLEQIDYINNKLAEGKTITKICESIPIGRTTVRDRFKRIGYLFIQIENKYIKSSYKNITKVNDISYKNNTIVNDAAELKNINNSKDIQDFNNIKKDILELVNIKDDLFQMLNDYKNHINVIEINKLDINDLPINLQENITTKSIKVYEPIYNEFDELCKEYSSIKKQDIVSLALYEFIKRYKK